MKKKVILLVDDDEDLRLSLRLELESGGFIVYEAGGVGEAAQVLPKITPDLIVLDVMMETPTAGFQFALELRDKDPNSTWSQYAQVPILLLTAIHRMTPFRFEPDDEYLPVEEIIEKPVDHGVLLEKVRNLIGRP